MHVHGWDGTPVLNLNLIIKRYIGAANLHNRTDPNWYDGFFLI